MAHLHFMLGYNMHIATVDSVGLTYIGHSRSTTNCHSWSCRL